MCYVYPPVDSCLKTFSGAYTPGDTLEVVEVSSVAYIVSISLAPLGAEALLVSSWFESSEHCSTSAMRTFGWAVSANAINHLTGCDASGRRGYYFWSYPGDGKISILLPPPPSVTVSFR